MLTALACQVACKVRDGLKQMLQDELGPFNELLEQPSSNADELLALPMGDFTHRTLGSENHAEAI